MTDQALLADYVRGRPGAFRELLERHAGLLYGVAWRVTGDRTMAEEVVQDVFCLLARKSTVLAVHPSVAGWLHRTATNTALGRRRRHLSHERTLAHFTSESSGSATTPPDAAGWEAIDAAVDRLPAEERIVVVMRFFEDLEYAQISAGLGISEAAARKRLSRGLQRLQRMIGTRPATALTAGALAVNVPPTVIGSVMSAVPSTAPSLGFFSTLIIMTQKHLLLVASATLFGGLTWFGASQWRENQRLAAEAARLRDLASDSATAVPAPPGGAAALAAAATQAAEMDALRTELAAERDKRLAAERDAKAVRDRTAPLSDQVVVAFGKVTEIGSKLGSLFTEALELSEMEKRGELNTPDGEVRFGKFIQKAASISGLSEEIIGFEDEPSEGSQFIASTYGSVFGLDESDRTKVAEFFSKQLADAKEKNLTLSHLPERGTPDFEPWLEKRWAYFNESRDALRQIIPEPKRALFDQRVEKGGYGFKNLTLKGAPMMFSLGGDPR